MNHEVISTITSANHQIGLIADAAKGSFDAAKAERLKADFCKAIDMKLAGHEAWYFNEVFSNDICIDQPKLERGQAT